MAQEPRAQQAPNVLYPRTHHDASVPHHALPLCGATVRASLS